LPHTQPHEHFIHEPIPGEPGWWSWDFKREGLFNALLGPLRVCRTDDGRALVRMIPESRHGNLVDVVHGGALLGFIDIALFAGARVHGVEMIGRAVTIDLQTQFIGAGLIGLAMDAEVEILRETKRLLFLRGIVHQKEGSHLVASFSGIIRKPSGDEAAVASK
jgi:acyl-coenzyme A thioesterase PaaI-like protein